ncbi:MAG: DUF1552 domain-containing protein [Acidobacteria bacterium]|nr:DUF1552 domain-containing protein [Acidobacteriota bacterium]
MFITQKFLPRRTVLRGMGATLALPLLDAMVPALSAASKTAAQPVRRAGFIYIPNGAVIDEAAHGFDAWSPTGEGSNFEFSTILKPLESLRDRLVVLSGLDHPMARSMGDGAGDHARGTATWLTGVHPKKTEGIDVRAGTTVDQIIAAQFGRETRLPSLEVALESPERVGNCEVGYSCQYLYTISWRTPTTPLPMENNPRVVFERLFGEGGTAAERLAEQRRDRSILDWVTGEVSDLRRQLGASDQLRVAEYLDSVREVERRIQMSETEGDTLSLELPPLPMGIPDGFEDHIKLMYDLLVLAYQADITRVGAFQISYETSSRTYPQIGVANSHHSLSHHSQNEENIAKLVKINTYHIEMLAYFLEQLRATPDGDGNLLDNSLMLYGGSMSDGNDHSHYPLPCLLAGGAAGRLEGGRHLRYEDGPAMTRALLNVLDLMDVHADEFSEATGVNERLAGV